MQIYVNKISGSKKPRWFPLVNSYLPINTTRYGRKCNVLNVVVFSQNQAVPETIVGKQEMLFRMIN
jgi:hypothetical protein